MFVRRLEVGEVDEPIFIVCDVNIRDVRADPVDVVSFAFWCHGGLWAG